MIRQYPSLRTPWISQSPAVPTPFWSCVGFDDRYALIVKISGGGLPDRYAKVEFDVRSELCPAIQTLMQAIEGERHG